MLFWCYMPTSKEILKQFSLTDEEVDVYVGLLKTGPAGVTDIAKKIKKNRTAVYFHMSKLVEKGVIRQTQEGRALMFSAVSPRELAERFDKLTTDFKSIVPQLEALQRAESDAPQIQVAESRSGYYKVYDEISSLPEGSTFLAIEGATALKNELTLLSNEETTNFYTKIIARHIGARVVMTEEAASIPSTSMSQENSDLLHQRTLSIKTYPESILPFQGLSLLYNDTVAYLFPETNLVITIKHPGIADAYRQTFDALFAGGKEYEYGEKDHSKKSS